MRKKIYLNLMLVSIGTLLLTTLILSFLFHEFYIDLLKNDLDDFSKLYISTTNEADLSKKKIIGRDIEVGVYQDNNLPNNKEGYVVVNRPLDADNTLQMRRPLRTLEYVIYPSLLIFVSLSIFLFVFVHLVVSRLANNLMEPIQSATQAMENILIDKNFRFENIYQELHPFIANMNLYKENTNYYVAKLKENEAFRREFTANVSHELKTPLTSINGYAEMISSGLAKPEDIPKLAGIIHTEGLRLLEMIESILELASLEDPSLRVEFEKLDLFQITEDIAYRMKARMKQKNLKLNLTGEHVIFEANKRMINDLIFNLLDNAIKYNNSDGNIDIEIKYNKDNKINFTITDSGIGISNENLERIFERFYMVNRSRSGDVRGSGLGLSIVKHIVEIHNGEIDIDSKLGVGTKIKIVF